LLAGAVFGVALSLVEPPFAVLLGADPAAWSGAGLTFAAAGTTALCGVVALLSARGRAW
jgi:hypothetical protein